MLKRSSTGWKLATGGFDYWILPNGAIREESGEPIRKADVMIVLGYFDQDMRQRIWEWWERQPQS